MKKLLITLLAAMTLGGAVLAQETPFPDIPAGHWAADAVARIADLGIVIGFPDGTFRGNESFTRYQAALVVSRMLDIVNSNISAAQAMTDADIASLRNAVQELAADVAAQGATVASISDDVNANTAAIEALQQALNRPEGVAPGVIEDLQNQLASLRVAVDTAQARADQALDAVTGLGAQVDQNTSDIAVLDDLVTRLNRDVTDLLEGAEGAPPTTAGLEARVARNESDIANIREFVILLRRDQVALRNRVAAVEDVNAQQDEQLASLDARVTTLEENAFTVSGSLTLSYEVGRLSGAEQPFDTDRIWGLNNDRDMGASAFSTGTADYNDDGDETDGGEVAQDRQDVEFAEGDFGTSLTLTFAFSPRGGAGPFSDFEAVVTLGLKKAVGLTDTDGNAFDGYVIVVDDLTTTFTVGTAPLTIQFGEDPEATFTPYVFDANGDGFAATLGSPDFLSFINPTIMVAYGEYDKTVDYDSDLDGTNDASIELYPNTYYRGARLTLNPFDGVTLGGSFAQLTANAREHADAASDNETVTVFGADAQIALSIFDIQAEYAQESGTITSEGAGLVNEDGDPIAETRGGDHTLYYVKLGVDGESLPILESFEANYRSMPADWDGIEYDDSDYPFVLDQVGFGVKATLNLFIVDLTGYYDSYSVASGDSAAAFGADAEINLFAAISLTGFYHSASINSVTVDDLDTGVDATETVVVAGMDRDNNYATEFGVKLEHDGAAENALIPGLNLSASYTQSEADFSKTTIAADVDFTLNVSVLTLTPYAGYETVTDTDAGADNTTTIKVGTGLETAQLDVLTQPSLMGAVNYRTTDHSAGFVASELQYSVGLKLNQFLFENSTLSARYGSWTGTNISADFAPPGFADDSATNISEGDSDLGDLAQSATGYEIAWNYFGLEFAYGAYDVVSLDSTGTATTATGGQAFSISYTIDF